MNSLRRDRSSKKISLVSAVVTTVLGSALAVLCFLSASDRATASATLPGIAYLGGPASGQVAGAFLGNDQPGAALAPASRFVATDPVAPAASSTLGAALLATGRPERAYAAFRVAGALGWRDVVTQLYWLEQARATNDVEHVAQRLNALLRLGSSNAAVKGALVQLGETGVGRTALTDLLQKNPPWGNRFILDTAKLEGRQLDARLQVLTMASQDGAKFDCDSVSYVVGRLINEKSPGKARTLWLGTCGGANSALVSNGDFETQRSDDSTSLFTWRLHSQGGLDVGVGAAPAPLAGRALYARSSLTAQTVVASQMALLAPGTYRLSWRATTQDGEADRTIISSVSCRNAQRLTPSVLSRQSNRRDSRFISTFKVPATGCPIQTVIISKDPGLADTNKTVWIDDVRIGRSTVYN